MVTHENVTNRPIKMLSVFLTGRVFIYPSVLILILIIYGWATLAEVRRVWTIIGCNIIFIFFLLDLIFGYIELVDNCSLHFTYHYKFVDYTYDDFEDCIYNNKDVTLRPTIEDY